MSAADFYAKQIFVYRTCVCGRARLCDREGVFDKKDSKETKKMLEGFGGGLGVREGKTVLKEESLSVFCARCEVVTTPADNRLPAISAERHQWVFLVCRRWGVGRSPTDRRCRKSFTRHSKRIQWHANSAVWLFLQRLLFCLCVTV